MTGMQLPATDKLADTWGTSYGTIHSALQNLVKEGWVERLDGSGTFVAEYQNRFVCAGIYHSTDIFQADALFSRALHTSLMKNSASRQTDAGLRRFPARNRAARDPARAEGGHSASPHPIA